MAIPEIEFDAWIEIVKLIIMDNVAIINIAIFFAFLIVLPLLAEEGNKKTHSKEWVFVMSYVIPKIFFLGDYGNPTALSYCTTKT